MGKTQDEIWRRKWIQNSIYIRLTRGLSLAMVTCRTFLYFLVGTLELNRKIHISKTKTFPNASELTGAFRIVRGSAQRRAEECPREQGKYGKKSRVTSGEWTSDRRSLSRACPIREDKRLGLRSVALTRNAGRNSAYNEKQIKQQ